MRFVQYICGDGAIKVGILSEVQKKISELKGFSSMVQFLASNPSIENLRTQLSGLPTVNISDVKLMSPITDPEKIIGVGLNYKDPAVEPPARPMFFSRFNNAITGPFDPVIAPKMCEKMIWEVELVAVIGKAGKKIKKEDVMDHIFGYCMAQDITARDWVPLNNNQVLLAKAMDTFCPLGPALVHKSLVPDPHKLNLKCHINGVLKQDGNTEHLIFNINELIHRVSQSITLKPGDILLTGTPLQLNFNGTPEEFLKPGDFIESEVECIGKMANNVIAE